MEISKEAQNLIKNVKDYLEQEVKPLINDIEEHDKIPHHVKEKLKSLGLFGLTIPKKYGGLGLSFTERCLIDVELGKGSGGIATYVANHTGIGTMGILNAGNEEQKQKYMPKMATGEVLACFALTEPNAGSDAASLEMTAELDGDHYILNGEKTLITNALVASLFTVIAKTEKGISAFLVEKDTPGFTIGKQMQTLGLKGSYVAPLSFENCKIPKENLLGKEGHGLSQAFSSLNRGRVSVSARGIGMMEQVLEDVTKHLLKRSQFGQPLANNQGIQWMLADIATKIHASRLMTFDAAKRLDRGEEGAHVKCSMAKYYTTEALGEVVDAGVQLAGGIGCLTGYSYERYFRDARACRVYEGSTQIQKNIIGSELLKKYKKILND